MHESGEVEAEISEAGDKEGGGAGLVKVADDGEVVGNEIEDAEAGVQQVECGQGGESSHHQACSGFFLGFLSFCAAHGVI